MRTLFILLLLFLNNSLADNHVYLELDCSTELGKNSVLILKQPPMDDSEQWTETLPFTSIGTFDGQFYMAKVKERMIEMTIYVDETNDISSNTEDTIKEMVMIDRYTGTLTSIYFNDDGTISKPLSFTGECKKRDLKKQF